MKRLPLLQYGQLAAVFIIVIVAYRSLSLPFGLSFRSWQPVDRLLLFLTSPIVLTPALGALILASGLGRDAVTALAKLSGSALYRRAIVLPATALLAGMPFSLPAEQARLAYTGSSLVSSDRERAAAFAHILAQGYILPLSGVFILSMATGELEAIHITIACVLSVALAIVWTAVSLSGRSEQSSQPSAKAPEPE